MKKGLRAVILAGGKGTRLRPYTDAVPKPLIAINKDEEVLGIIIRQLAKYGFSHITIAVNHLADKIMEYAGDGSKWGVRIDYSRETKPLSTIAPLTLIPDLPEHFLVINGDTLTSLDYGKFLKDHIDAERRISVSVKKREVKIDFGVLLFDKSKRLNSFEEKPTHYSYVAMGVNCFSRLVIDALKKNESHGFDALMRDSLVNNKHVFVVVHDGFWLDVGRPEDYHYAIENYDKIKKTIGI